MRRRALLFVATAGAVIAADQFTKALVRSAMEIGDSTPLIRGVLWLTHVHNTGAAFGILGGQQYALIAVAAVVLAAIAYIGLHLRPASPFVRTALALIAAGAAGNLIDRVAFGGVTDFLDLGWWPVFNVADMSLDIGVALLVWWILFRYEQAEEHIEPTQGAPDAEAVDD